MEGSENSLEKDQRFRKKSKEKRVALLGGNNKTPIRDWQVDMDIGESENSSIIDDEDAKQMELETPQGDTPSPQFDPSFTSNLPPPKGMVTSSQRNRWHPPTIEESYTYGCFFPANVHSSV